MQTGVCVFNVVELMMFAWKLCYVGKTTHWHVLRENIFEFAKYLIVGTTTIAYAMHQASSVLRSFGNALAYRCID